MTRSITWACIVQLDFSAVFDRVSQSGLLFKLKSIGVQLVAACCPFVGNSSPTAGMPQGVPQGSLLSPLLFILYSSEMFELVENGLYAYAYDSTLLAVVRQQADRPAVAASLNKDLAGIQEWCSNWCMILNLNKTKALTLPLVNPVNPSLGDLVLSGVSINAGPNLDIVGVKLDFKLTFEDHVSGIVSHVSLRELVFRGW